jgi:DNA-binding HxlR family transcriptional regulator
MSRRYGQYCGLARALEMVGERWGMLVVRDLILGPKRYTELREGLPRIPASILTARLNELEEAGVVRRRMLPQLDASVVYELTEYGSELEGVVLQLGLWGARSLGEPTMDEVFTVDSAVLSLYTTFRPERAGDASVVFELHYPPDMVVHAVVEHGELKVCTGQHPDADLVMDVRGPVKPLLAGEISPGSALASGLLHLEGDPALLDLFVDLFHVPAAPRPVEGLVLH